MWQIIQFGSLVSDNFATPVSFISGFTFTQAPVGNVIDLTARSSIGGVPEPSTYALIAAGLALIYFGRRSHARR